MVIPFCFEGGWVSLKQVNLTYWISNQLILESLYHLLYEEEEEQGHHDHHVVLEAGETGQVWNWFWI